MIFVLLQSVFLIIYLQDIRNIFSRLLPPTLATTDPNILAPLLIWAKVCCTVSHYFDCWHRHLQKLHLKEIMSSICTLVFLFSHFACCIMVAVRLDTFTAGNDFCGVGRLWSLFRQARAVTFGCDVRKHVKCMWMDKRVYITSCTCIPGLCTYVNTHVRKCNPHHMCSLREAYYSSKPVFSRASTVQFREETGRQCKAGRGLDWIAATQIRT